MKNNYNIFEITILVLVIGISKVFANDCEIWSNFMLSFNETFYEDFQNKSFTNCCEYDGLTCNSNFITGINLTYKTVDMVTMSYKFKFNDEVVGHLQSLSQLASLQLINLYIEGNLSEKLGDLTNLEILDLNNNYLKGNIPKSLLNLKKLKKLDLSHNRIEGYVPYEFKNFENLETLNLNNNYSLKGYVPLIPNLKTCDYSLSNLCYLRSEKCTGFDQPGSDGCTEEDIKETNYNNGNPNPESDEFKDEDVKPLSYKIIRIVIVVVVIFLIIGGIGFCVYVKNKKKKLERNLDDANNLIDNNLSHNTITSNTYPNVQPLPNVYQDNIYSATPYIPPSSSTPFTPYASTTTYPPPSSTTSYYPPTSSSLVPDSTKPKPPPYAPSDSSSLPPYSLIDSTTANDS